VAIIDKKPRKYRPRPPYNLALHYTIGKGHVYRTDFFLASTAAEAMLGCLQTVQQVPADSRRRFSVALHLYLSLSLSLYSSYSLGIVLDPEHDNPEDMDEAVGACWKYLGGEIRAGRLFTYSNPRKKVTGTWPWSVQ
jgi:hypothetical protein